MQNILHKAAIKLPYIVIAVIVTILIFFQLLGIYLQKTVEIAEVDDGYADAEVEYVQTVEVMDSVQEIEEIFKEEQAKSVEVCELEKKRQEIDEKIAKYIDLDNEYQINKTIKLSENTPLDMLTSSIIVYYSEKFNVPTSLILALIELESNFDQYAVAAAKDRGYCQIIPGTEKWLFDHYGHLLEMEYDPERIFEPEYNIGLGTLYLWILQSAYKDDYHRILSEYNKGPYELKAHYQQQKTYETAYSRIVLKKETKYKKLLAASY